MLNIYKKFLTNMDQYVCMCECVYIAPSIHSQPNKWSCPACCCEYSLLLSYELSVIANRMSCILCGILYSCGFPLSFTTTIEQLFMWISWWIVLLLMCCGLWRFYSFSCRLRPTKRMCKYIVLSTRRFLNMRNIFI